MAPRVPFLRRITADSSLLALAIIFLSELLDSAADLLLPHRRPRDDREFLIERRADTPPSQPNRRLTRADRRRNGNFATRGFLSLQNHDRRLLGPGRRASDWNYT